MEGIGFGQSVKHYFDSTIVCMLLSYAAVVACSRRPTYAPVSWGRFPLCRGKGRSSATLKMKLSHTSFSDSTFKRKKKLIDDRTVAF